MRSKSSPLKAPADREILRFWQRNLSDALIFLSRRGIVPLGHGKVILKAIKAKKSEIAEMSYPEAECALWEQRMIALEDLSDLLRVMDPNQRHLLRAFARIDKNSSTEDPLFQFDLNATGQRPRVTGTIAFKLKQEYPIVIIRFEHPGGNDAGRAKPLKEFRLGVDKIIVRGLKNAAIQAQSREHVSTFLIHLDGADIDPGTNHYVEPWMHNVRLTEGWSYDVDPRNIIDVFRRSMERWVALCCEIETQARPTIGRQLNAHDNLMRRSS
jgi:hypothetical protein